MVLALTCNASEERMLRAEERDSVYSLDSEGKIIILRLDRLMFACGAGGGGAPPAGGRTAGSGSRAG